MYSSPYNIYYNGFNAIFSITDFSALRSLLEVSSKFLPTI